MVQSRADDYRAKAEQCQEMARLVSDMHAKQELLKIAHGWITMAKRVEQDNDLIHTARSIST